MILGCFSLCLRDFCIYRGFLHVSGYNLQGLLVLDVSRSFFGLSFSVLDGIMHDDRWALRVRTRSRKAEEGSKKR